MQKWPHAAGEAALSVHDDSTRGPTRTLASSQRALLAKLKGLASDDGG